MNDYLVSLIRTWVPIGIGSLITWLSVSYGVVLSDDSSKYLILGAVGLVVGLYYAIARAVEAKFPALGRLLVGLGARTPVYPPTAPESVEYLRNH